MNKGNIYISQIYNRMEILKRKTSLLFRLFKLSPLRKIRISHIISFEAPKINLPLLYWPYFLMDGISNSARKPIKSRFMLAKPIQC